MDVLGIKAERDMETVRSRADPLAQQAGARAKDRRKIGLGSVAPQIAAAVRGHRNRFAQHPVHAVVRRKGEAAGAIA